MMVLFCYEECVVFDVVVVFFNGCMGCFVLLVDVGVVFVLVWYMVLWEVGSFLFFVVSNGELSVEEF